MNWDTAETAQLVRALQSLKTAKETQSFLRDVLTEAEILDIARRLETARLLAEGTPYPMIQQKTGFSTATIARVSKWLKEGSGGYRLVLSRLHHRTPHLVESGVS